MRERWALLYQVVPQESKTSELRIDRSFVVQGTVFKVEYKAGGDAISMRHLDQVAVGQGFALQRPQHKKAMNQSFGVVHGDLPNGRLAEKEEHAAH